MNSRIFWLIVPGLIAWPACRRASVPDLDDARANAVLDGASAVVLDGLVEELEADPPGGRAGAAAEGQAAGGPNGTSGTSREGASGGPERGTGGGEAARASEPTGIGGSQGATNGDPSTQGTSGASGSTVAAASGSVAPAEGTSGSFVAGSSGSTGTTEAAGTTGGLSGSVTSGTPSGVVQFVNVQSDGGTSSDALSTSLAKAKQRYRACFGRALAAGIEPTGTVKLRANVTAEGKIESVSVIGGNVSPGVLVQCTVAVTQSIKVGEAAAPSSRATFDVKYSRS